MERSSRIGRRLSRPGPGKKLDRYSLAIYAALFLYAVVVGFAAYKTFAFFYNGRLVASARAAASILSVSDVAALSGQPEDVAKPEFQRLYATVSSFLLSDPNIKYAYLFTLRDGKEIAYLNAPLGPEGIEALPGTVLGSTERREDRFFERGGAIVFPPYRDPWGFWISVAVPAIRDTATGRVLVAFGYDVAVSNWFLLSAAVVFIVAFIIAVGGILVWIGLARLWRLRIAAERLADAERAKKDTAEARERAEREFLALMSHEIRNPLSAVVGFSRLLSETRLDPEQRDQVSMLRASSDHLMDLVNDILDFSKIEAGKMEIVARPFSPVQLAEGVVSLFSLQALRKGLDLRLEADPSCPAFLSGDAVRVRQIVVNLASNAVKFTEAGRVTVSLGYDPSAEPGRLRLTVEDTGPGIDAETLERLFTAFKQGEEGRRRGGTGLGLAISKSLAELMGGRISAKSEPGVGSLFSVELPLPPCEAPAEEVVELGGLLSGLRVLAADDDEANRALVTGLLARRGATVVTAADGDEALAALIAGVQSGSFDAAVIDRSMPGKGGPEVARALRAVEASASQPPLRLIALTGSITAEGVRECREAGFDVVLPKPFDLDRLVEALLPSGSPRGAIGGAAAPAVPAADDAAPAASPKTEAEGASAGVDASADPAAAGAGGLIDEAALRERAEYDEELVGILRSSFVENLAACLAAAKAALGAGDLAAAAASAHKLRGSALNACAEEIARLAGGLETAARAGDGSGARAALEAIAARREGR